jgi:hypothetical protein
MKRIIGIGCLVASAFISVNLSSVSAQSLNAYPTDPAADINWSAGTSTVADI